jgi:hypothetical protein
MVDEATVAIGSAEMVVLPAGLTSAGWKRAARERLVIEAMVLVVAVGSEERVRVGSSGNVARLRSLKSVAQAASILLASEDGIGWFLMSRVTWILRSKLRRAPRLAIASHLASSCGGMGCHLDGSGGRKAFDERS